MKATEKAKMAMRRRNAERTKAGLCSRCDNPNEGNSRCPSCLEEARTEYADAKKDQAVKRKTIYAALKHAVVLGYGGQCSCCGEDIEIFLTIDHKNNDGADERRQSNFCNMGFYRRIIAKAFPAKYQLLCFNCNCGRAQNDGICPHVETRNLNG